MTGYGPPDDPSEAPTGQYNYSDYGDDGQQHPEPGSTPWHRKPAVLIGLAVLAALLIALVIFGIIELTKGGGSTSPATSSTTPAVTTTTTTPSSSSATTTEPAAPAPTTTLTTAPTTTAPTSTAPTSTSIDDGRHHHHHHADGGMP